ncbi:MAG: hypothetical protein JRM86_00605 [Nitrososphaerota archaeon]|nr:hypothetical protein [Nitrososphaerota archaeon]MDG7021808.1 hypothetical protein [Nitrososphaerota archaeon]
MKKNKISCMERGTNPTEQRAARKTLEDAISESLREMLGGDGLELVSKILPMDLAAADPRRLHEVLVSVFKEKGALMVEREIAKRLLARMGDAGKGVEAKVRAVRRLADVADLPANHERRLVEAMDEAAQGFAAEFATGT